jgi:hypothetical protein
VKKHRIILISTLLLGIAILSGAVFGSVSAEESPTTKPAVWLQVSPTSRAITLNPSDKYDGEFTVTNIGSEDFIFKVYANPFSVTNESYDHDYLSEKNYNQIHRWITIPESEFSLPVGESQVVKFHVSVPENAPGGSQHAVIFAESSGNQASSSNSSGIKAISRVGMRLKANITGEIRESIEITEYNIPSLYIFFGGSQITATSKIKNTGNTDGEAKYNFEIKPFFGGDSVFVESKNSLIYPESEYRQTIAWENTPLLGLFTVNYSVAVNDIARAESRVVLVMPVWLLVIVLMLLTFLIIWITLTVKKRRKLRSRMRF